MPLREPAKSLFATRVKSRREEMGYTLDALGRKVGTTEGAVWKWENEDRETDYATLIRVATVLHVTVDWLIGGPGAPTPPVPRIPRSVWRDLRAAQEAFRALERVASALPLPDDEKMP